MALAISENVLIHFKFKIHLKMQQNMYLCMNMVMYSVRIKCLSPKYSYDLNYCCISYNISAKYIQ